MIWLFCVLLVTLWNYAHYLHLNREVIRDADGEPYLVRYFLWKPKDKKKGRIYLHHILRSDHDRSKHDHPWNFASLIVWGGYYEIGDMRLIHPQESGWKGLIPGTELALGELGKYFGTGSLLRRGAGWRHRLILPAGKTAWTIVKTSQKVREWGFHLPDDTFCRNRNYDIKTGLCSE
jgi:hypothetical protein